MFAPHGAALGVGTDETVTGAALRRLDLVRRIAPDVIVVCSPHFVWPDCFLVNSSGIPPVTDERGAVVAQPSYRPPGDRTLALRLVRDARARGHDVKATDRWGLDVAAWTVTARLAPASAAPCVAISISGRPAAEHVAWGASIAETLRGVGLRGAFVASGVVLHEQLPETRWPEAQAIEAEIVDLMLKGRTEEIAAFEREKWRTVGPEGDLLPYFILAGAVGSARGRVVSNERVRAAGMTVLEFAAG